MFVFSISTFLLFCTVNKVLTDFGFFLNFLQFFNEQVFRYPYYLEIRFKNPRSKIG